MSSIYLVYTTDAWNNYSSRELISVCTTLTNCMKVIRADVREGEKEKLSEDDKKTLERYRQTQGREENYDIEEVNKNILL